MKISTLRKIISFFIPVRIWSGAGSQNPFLELAVYRGRWQLSTKDALYSDGERYRPLVAAFEKIRPQLPDIKDVLLLGSGLGSARAILESMHFEPAFTFVDADQKVLELADALLTPDQKKRIHFVCEDAYAFVQDATGKFDMVIVDVFIGRMVPPFVSQPQFMSECHRLLRPGGFFILNYMINNPEDGRRFSVIADYWKGSSTVLDLGINKVLVTTA